MSHFTVVVRIPSKSLEDGDDATAIDAELHKILLPYQEFGGWDNQKEMLKPYMKFNSTTEEWTKEYENDNQNLIVDSVGLFSVEEWVEKYKAGEIDLLSGTVEEQQEQRNSRKQSYHVFTLPKPDGDGSYIVTMRYSWDEKYRIPGTFGTGSDTHKEPARFSVKMPYTTLYRSFEDYVKGWHGSPEKDPEANDYGYWQNPDAKWDWFKIGGRWSGFFPVKGGGKNVDVIRVKDIDFDAAVKASIDKATEFFGHYTDYISSSDGDEEARKTWEGMLYGHRYTGIKCGLVDCLDEDELTDEHKDPTKYKIYKWESRGEGQGTRYDVVKIEERETFMKDRVDFFNTLSAYAYLADGEWRAPGEMGWFGMSSDSVEASKKHKKAFCDALREGDQEDTLVLVDCHI